MTRVRRAPRAGFATNLQLLCSYAPSVSFVCRRLAMNRQQFARYLNGEAVPSPQNLRRICDHFGVEPEEIFLPPARFKALVRDKPSAAIAPPPANFLQRIFAANPPGAHRYVGYYTRYTRSIEYPGTFVCAVIRIYPSGDQIMTKAIERLRSHRSARRSETFKYAGNFVLLGDRIFIVEAECLQHDSMDHIMLYASHKSPLRLVFGKMMSISSGPSREPYFAPVVYEFAGVRPKLPALMRRCQQLSRNSSLVDERIREYVLS